MSIYNITKVRYMNIYNIPSSVPFGSVLQGSVLSPFFFFFPVVHQSAPHDSGKEREHGTHNYDHH